MVDGRFGEQGVVLDLSLTDCGAVVRDNEQLRGALPKILDSLTVACKARKRVLATLRGRERAYRGAPCPTSSRERASG